MYRESLDMYESYPREMLAYLKNHGWHFTRKAYEYAVSKMKGRDGGKIEPMQKAAFDEMFKKHNVKLENDTLYDGAYVLAMAMSDYYHSSVKDEQSLCLFVKDTIDDVDAPDGAVFAKWYACSMRGGIPVDWEEIL